nr:putative f-box protein [Quercus suber]
MSDSNKSIGWGYLPDEILTQIFTFLPIKSIIICTSVSKTWKSLIKNPTFISTHLHHSHNKSQNLFLLFNISWNGKQVYTLHKEDDPDFIVYTSFDSPFHAPAPDLRGVAGTCNGLICLSNHAEGIFLWNPCVRKFLQLPYPNVNADDTHGLSFGFGFDPKTNDYKVVRILSIFDSPFDFVKSRPVVEVYSLLAGEWRMLTASTSASLPPICAIIGSVRPAFANGALHWIAFTNDYKQFVLVFDLGDEVFRQILLPEFPEKMMCTRLSVYGNSIAVFIDQMDQISIWVMKECGVASSWTPFFTAHFDFGEAMLTPIGFRRNGDAVFVFGEGKLVSWNPEIKKIKPPTLQLHTNENRTSCNHGW